MLADSFIALASLLALREARIPHPQPVIIQSLPVARYLPGPQPPTKKDPNSFGIETTARAAIVMDVASGEILYEKNAETPYPIASLTKLTTAMTLLDKRLPMDEEITLLAQDDPKEGRVIFPEAERFTRRELLRALLIGSVNTAGEALARTAGGREAFITSMNAKAQKIGVAQAQFNDPTGLDSENQASAHEVALTLRAALSYPEIRDITKMEQIELIGRNTKKPYLIKSTNLLLSSFLNKAPYDIIAGKTGSLQEAGFCLAQATRNKEGHEVIAVVLGSDNHFSRFQDAKALTYWAFETFSWPEKASGRTLPLVRRATYP